MKVVLALFAALLALAPVAGGAPPKPRDYDPVLSPDGATVAFVHNAGTSASIELVGVDGRHRRTLVPKVWAQYLAWSPDGKTLAYSDRYDVWRVDVAAGAPVRLTGDESTQSSESLQPAWSPDGRTIAYTRFQDCYRCTATWLVDADGTNLRPVYVHDASRRPAFSPDGTKLVLSLAQALVIDLAGNVVVPGSGAYAIWSPKGAYLAWTGGGLWLRNLQTGTTRRVSPAIGAQVAWSPDGKWIAGGYHRGVGVVWAKDGSHLRRLPASGTGATPSFSHGLLAYVHAGQCGIDLAREDGTHARRLTHAC